MPLKRGYSGFGKESFGIWMRLLAGFTERQSTYVSGYRITIKIESELPGFFDAIESQWCRLRDSNT